MAYIGKTPVIGNFQVCDAITVVDAQAAYTMQVSSVDVFPESANHMLVSLNGILQAPTTSFTVSGSTITFASALETGDVIDFIQILGNVLDLGVPSDNTVTTAKLADSSVTTAKLNDDSVSLAKLTATGTKDATTFLRGDNTFDVPPLGGITEADQWRLNADSNTGSNAFVTANWERNDTSGFSKIGTGLSESSGVFSFASTGIYLITFYAQFEMEAGDGAAEFIMHKTTDNSTYAEAALALAGNDATSGGAVGTAANSFMFDVTDISTHKFKFKTGSMGGTTFLLARTNYNATGFTMTRLGDT
jgi:hypothetical protein